MRGTIFKFAISRRNVRERGSQLLLCWRLRLQNFIIVVNYRQRRFFFFFGPPKYVERMGTEEPSAQHFHPCCPSQSRTTALTRQDSALKEASEPTSKSRNPQSFLPCPALNSLINWPPARTFLPSLFPLPSPHGPYSLTRVPRLSLIPAHGSLSPSVNRARKSLPLGPLEAPQPLKQASSLLVHSPWSSHPAPLPETPTPGPSPQAVSQPVPSQPIQSPNLGPSWLSPSCPHVSFGTLRPILTVHSRNPHPDQAQPPRIR